MIPIGFRSFSEDPKGLEASAAPAEMSFAEDDFSNNKILQSCCSSSKRNTPGRILTEIQKRKSLTAEDFLGPNEDDPALFSKIPQTKGIQEKRDQKLSAKKNELYVKILKEHGLSPG